MVKHFAVIGNPIEHSLSPLIHAANFKELGLDWTYDKILVEDLSQLRDLVQHKNLSGLNVTLPHKLTVTKYLDDIVAPDWCNAVNTIKVVEDKLVGYNTDIYGFFQDLEDKNIQVDGKNILILGFGGLGQTLARVFRTRGEVQIFKSEDEILVKNMRPKMVVVANRSPKDGVDVVQPVQDMLKSIENYDVIINTMKICALDYPGSSQDVSRDFHGSFYDCSTNISQILQTINLETSGKSYNGAGMLVHQGAKSFEIWSGMKANVEAMMNSIFRYK